MLSQKSQPAVLSEGVNQRLNHGQLGVAQLLAPGTRVFVLAAEISAHAGKFVSIATVWALRRVRVMRSRGEGSGFYVVWEHFRTSYG